MTLTLKRSKKRNSAIELVDANKILNIASIDSPRIHQF